MNDIVSFDELMGGDEAPASAPAPKTDYSSSPDHLAVKYVESRGNPNAVSPKGAKGSMQVMDDTARDPGFGIKPAKNLADRERVGNEYLSALLNKYKDPADAYAAYNWGPTAVDKWIAGGRDPRKMPAETRQYVQDVMHYKKMSDARRNREEIEADVRKPRGKQDNILSLEDLYGKAPDQPAKAPEGSPRQDTPGNAAKRFGMNVAAGLDLIAGVVPMTAGLAANAMTYMTGVLNPFSDKSIRQSEEEGQEVSKAINQAIGNPIRKFLLHDNPDLAKTYDQGVVNKSLEKASNILDQGVDKLVEHTNGNVTKAEAETLRDWLMVFGPVGAGKIARTVTKGKPIEAGAPKTEPTADWTSKYQKVDAETTGPTPAPKPMEMGETTLPPPQKAPTPPIGQGVGLIPKTRLTEGIPMKGAKETPPAPKPIYTGAPPALDTGLAKVRAGQQFLMTPEERIAIRNAGTSPKMAGKADVTLLGVIALGGTGLALANAYPDFTSKLGGAALVGSMFLPMKGRGADWSDTTRHADTAPLSAVMADMNFSTSIIDQLNKKSGNKFVFNKTEIQDLMKQQSVTKAEREVMQGILDSRKGESITAKDLVLGLHEETGNWVLEPKETQQFADYGLDNIDRMEARESHPGAGLGWEGIEANEMIGPASARTSIWRLPEHMEMDTANHFQEPRYFGHTRSFDEGGMRHVVEVQSDLAQRAGKPLSPDRLMELKQELGEVERQLAETRKPSPPPPPGAQLDYSPRLREQELLVRHAEIMNKLSEAAVPSQLGPILKGWEKRLVREEMAQAAREGNDKIRFATADTMAKVERWPTRNSAEQALEYAKEKVRTADDPNALEYMKEYERNAQQKLDAFGDANFLPEHQGIYNRYAGELTKFLKQQGAREVVDAQGHSWWEVPTGFDRATGRGGRQARMFGKANTELLTQVGLAGAGALLAAQYADIDKFEALIAGGMAGLLVARAPQYAANVSAKTSRYLTYPATVAGMTAAGMYINQDHPFEGAIFGLLYGLGKTLPKPDLVKVNGSTIDDLVNARNGAIAVRERETWNVAQSIRELVPEEKRREAIADMVENNTYKSLTGKELAAAQTFSGYMKSYGQAAKDVGLIEDFTENYVTHIVERSGGSKTKVQEAMEAIFGKPHDVSAGGLSRFAKTRKYDTFADLQKALQGTDLQLKTKDIAEIVEIYGRSMGKAIENKAFKDTMMTHYDTPQNNQKYPMIMEMGKAPPDYKTIDTPQLRGYAVHPELAGPLKFVMSPKREGEVVAGLKALSMAQKRLATGFSFFHASNLFQAYVGANGMKGLNIPDISQALKVWKSQGLGGTVDDLLKAGLKVDPPSDMGRSALTQVGVLADAFVEHAIGLKQKTGEWALGGLENVQKQIFDRVTWDWAHRGMKLSTAIRHYEQQLLRNPNMPKEEVARQVASFTNDTFGGLDWYRVATETQSAIARKIALSALSPQGMTYMQIGMFAPDWTFSTFRSMYKALPGATSLPLTAKLHQKYVMRAGLIYATVANGANYVTSDGNFIWENHDKKGHWDPLRLHWADGQTQQWGKHATEGPEWAVAPRKTMLNKLGFVLKTPAEILADKEYLTAEGGPPMQGSRMAHLGKALVPITFSSTDMDRGIVETAKRLGLSMVGLPIYGLPPEEMKEKAKERAEERKKRKEAHK